MQADDFALYHLVTSSNCGTGATVGIAWLNTLCMKNSFTQNLGNGLETVAGAGVSAAIIDEWAVIAHEIGHNFGELAVHDCTSTNLCSNTCDAQTGASPGSASILKGTTSGCDCCACQKTSTSSSSSQCSCDGKFLMNPSEDSSHFEFSPCSIGTICSQMPQRSCLQDPGTQPVITLSVCGNGIREDGEECDCGGVSGCQNSLCCVTAVCDDKSDGCCASCNVVTNTTFSCRPARSSCDIAEFCDGKNQTCPVDKFLEDGKTCTDVSGAKCASGECTNRDIQCKLRGRIGSASNNISVTNFITGGCPEQGGTCQFYCNHATLGCQRFVGNFLDGTSCGGDGICKNGVCTGGQWYNAALEWITNNQVKKR
ncbi:hypothetical protein HK096_009704, partial [Nowakowskiella sp. JEL0078]